MATILVIADFYPDPQESSGSLRFFTLLSLLARKHDVYFCALDNTGVARPRDETAIKLERAGIKLGDGSLASVLRHVTPDVVWFEFYHMARTDYLGLLERRCPRARIVIDSVDVHFNRLEARARLTGDSGDQQAAEDIKALEVSAYAVADMIIAVSEKDRLLIKQHLPESTVEVIPNVHSIPPFPDIRKRRYGELVFVGGFRHDPNIDAMEYFCHEVMPRIVVAHPEARLKIIGSNPPQAIYDLASENVEVVGFVPDTSEYLEAAYISIAPLRYGGGMKGKVGEAMSYGLPVVTTSYGVEGFGFEVGKDVLVGDSPESFAAQVLALLDNPKLHEQVARSGYTFISSHYSVPAVERRLDETMQRLDEMSKRFAPLGRRLMLALQGWYSRNIAWRLRT
jgi:O-antigen biosynthesis protein